MRNALFVPLSNHTLVLERDSLGLHTVRLAQFEPVLVACDGQNPQLVGVPVFSVDFFEVVLAVREDLGVPSCAGLADEHSMLQFKVRGLVTHAVHTVGIELIVCDSFFEQSF